eukprot:7475706-Pyramimonas_sp.AAC.1
MEPGFLAEWNEASIRFNALLVEQGIATSQRDHDRRREHGVVSSHAGSSVVIVEPSSQNHRPRSSSEDYSLILCPRVGLGLVSCRGVDWDSRSSNTCPSSSPVEFPTRETSAQLGNFENVHGMSQLGKRLSELGKPGRPCTGNPG